MQSVMDFFPFESVRPVQKDCMDLVDNAISSKSHLIMHAPTGLGKTAATLVPAIKYALDNDKTVFFLTSRNTQHHLAIETISAIKQKSQSDFLATDIIGKQSLCSVPFVEKLYAGEFSEFCNKMKEDRKCIFFEKTKKQSGAMTPEAKLLLDQLKVKNPVHSEEFLDLCKSAELCPYEMATTLASQSRVIVADQYHLFHPSIRPAFLGKIKKNLADSIIIVDEAHNLPQRLRDTLTARLTTNSLKLSVKEAKKFGFTAALEKLVNIQDALNALSKGMRVSEEKLLKMQDLVLKIRFPYEKLVEELASIGEKIREEQHLSHLARVAEFLKAWKSDASGFARIISMQELQKQPNIVLSYRCLDPNICSAEVVKGSHSTILVSGTLNPTYMYKDLLGFPDNTKEASLSSPFPAANKLALIVPETTTKFAKRSPEQFDKIANICSSIAMSVPGNIAVFFPSYSLLEAIKLRLNLFSKPVFVEDPHYSRQERKELLDTFKKQKKAGAVLLAVSSGSFGEGIDLPGDLLRAVIVVGMPFKTPNLETKELINYYDKKFGKGWEYGYVLPTMTRILQNAGRCIRSETDRGVIVFLDERYSFYRRCFPSEWDTEISRDCISRIRDFFSVK
ncbi:MAG: ATP-dependent DNA helicase [Candidatus Woesearchaeota archaeon]